MNGHHIRFNMLIFAAMIKTQGSIFKLFADKLLTLSPDSWIKSVLLSPLFHLIRSINNQMTRHLATFRESQFLPPFTRAWLDLFTLTEYLAEITLCQQQVPAGAVLCFNQTVGFPWSVPVLSVLLNVSRSGQGRINVAASWSGPQSGCRHVLISAVPPTSGLAQTSPFNALFN